MSVSNEQILLIAEARDKLKKLRDGQKRQSEEVVDIWEQALVHNRDKLPDESKLINPPCLIRKSVP